LAAADRENYANAVAAVDDARKQLLEALFEGAVRAEGVTVYPTEPPAYEPPSIEYDEWSPINQGVWLHDRYDKEGEDSYRLNTISVHWNGDYIDYFNSDGEWAERLDEKIRLLCTYVDREFPARETTTHDPTSLDGPAAPPYRTGAAGRPTSRDLALQEMRRRATEGTLCSSLAEQAREICIWLKQQHPEAPQPTAKTLETSLRHEYWRLKRSATRLP
jgi:hypothetical protein